MRDGPRGILVAFAISMLMWVALAVVVLLATRVHADDWYGYDDGEYADGVEDWYGYTLVDPLDAPVDAPLYVNPRAYLGYSRPWGLTVYGSPYLPLIADDCERHDGGWR